LTNEQVRNSLQESLEFILAECRSHTS
jgi:hypothetical protein